MFGIDFGLYQSILYFKLFLMKNISKHHLHNFNDLNNFITNTVSPTILAFTTRKTFGQYWLEKMEQALADSFRSALTFNIIIQQKTDELKILTRVGEGPVIFFIKNRRIVTKSIGKVSEIDFMIKLIGIYPMNESTNQAN